MKSKNGGRGQTVFTWNTVMKGENLGIHLYRAYLKENNVCILCKSFPDTVNTPWKKNSLGALISIFWKTIKKDSFTKSCKGMEILPTTKWMAVVKQELIFLTRISGLITLPVFSFCVPSESLALIKPHFKKTVPLRKTHLSSEIMLDPFHSLSKHIFNWLTN